MAKKKTTTKKTNTKKATKKQKVWVASYRFENRHGDSGADILGVYDTEEKAKEACGNNIEMYLGDFGAIREDKTIDPDAVFTVDDENVPEGMTLAQAREATSIDIDNSGTWCIWSIDEKDVE